MYIKASEIDGKEVINEEGFTIGEVVDTIVDTESWDISDLQVKIEKESAKEVGLKTPFFGSLLVLIEVELISSTSDKVVLSLLKDDLKDYVEGRIEEEKEAEKAAKAAEKAAKKAAKAAEKAAEAEEEEDED